MTYQEAVDYISGLTEMSIKPGRERIAEALAILKRPFSEYPHVLIGGTNGKGSTLAFMGAVLDAAGYRAGLFTSPHLFRFEERIRVGPDSLPSEVLPVLVEEIRALNVPLSYFEFATAMALLYFARMKVDIALLEVGLGGRWDATNATDPILSIVTGVALDHTEWLGHSVEAVAVEKAQIMRPGRSVVVGRLPEEAERVVLREAAACGADVVLFDRDFSIRSGPGGLLYRGRSWRLERIVPGLRGVFQQDNAGCALAALERLEEHGFHFSREAILQGVRKAVWPGRFQSVVRDGRAGIIVDSAHNPHGIRALIRSLPEEEKPPIWLISALREKNVRGMAREIARVGGPVFLVPLDHPRAMAVREMSRFFEEAGIRCGVYPDVDVGLSEAEHVAAERGGRVVAAGSVVLAAKILELCSVRPGGTMENIP
ncbi:MAG: bifunctional folylpolyglutamate synthase/dihydrofolate synthase [Deltaproteobacteria bacterium]|nr:bifunctional folylpolyglutamate synthase/dihydrofolate synthase [Deltaproteobacteria bacterium]